jgi:RND family efflux transporter MFP subunit
MTRPFTRPVARAARLAPAALAAVLAAGACSNKQEAAAAPAGGGAPNGPGGGGRERPPLVLAATDVAPVRRGRIEAGIPLSGDLRPIQRVTVRAALEGDLARVLARPGDAVRAGQLLAEFESSVEQSSRAAAGADLAAARSDVATARWNAEQARELFRAGAVAEREARVADQALAAARAREAAAAAAVRAAAQTAGNTRVVAPLTGVVESRAVEGTEHVARGAELFTVVRADVLELAASVPERAAGEVRPGQTVRLNVAGRAVDGRVARVSPTVDPATRAATVFVQIPNPGARFKGNSFATGRAVGRALDGALLVPTAALRQAQEEAGAGATRGAPAPAPTFVFRVRGGAAERVGVSLGVVDEQAGVAEVVDGLDEGDRVIVGNVSGVGRGVRVQVLGNEARGGDARGAGGNDQRGAAGAGGAR